MIQYNCMCPSFDCNRYLLVILSADFGEFGATFVSQCVGLKWLVKYSTSHLTEKLTCSTFGDQMIVLGYFLINKAKRLT